MLPTLYTTKEVAKYLKVSDGYVRELLRNGMLKRYVEVTIFELKENR